MNHKNRNNYHRFTLLIALFLFASTSTIAQIEVGKGVGIGGAYGSSKKLQEESFELFKKSTLIITIPNKDSNLIEFYQSEIRKVWDLVPFEVITINKINDYANKLNYSFGTIGGIAFNMGASDTKKTAIPCFMYDYEIWMPIPNKLMNVKERIIFARILLQPDIATSVIGTFKSYNEIAWGRIRFGQGPVVKLYETGNFYNFGYGYFKGFFKVINDGLKAEESISMQNNSLRKENKEILQKLKSDTLFALEISQIKSYINPNSKESYSKELIKREEKKLEKDLDESEERTYFVVKYLNEGAMNEKIRTAEKPFFYFDYIATDNGKYVSVYEGLTGNLVYQRHDLLFAVAKHPHFYFKKIGKEIK